MSGGSVRDRIRAAEALQGNAKGQGASPTGRRSHKLALNTDEHIKEEFLRRGDGGWSKNVDIGQQQPFGTPPSVPFIKVTSETPVVAKPAQKLPNKLPKGVHGAFATVEEVEESSPTASEHEASVPNLTGQGPMREEENHVDDGRQDIPVSKFESLLDEQEHHRPSTPRASRSRSQSRNRSHSVGEPPEAPEELGPRERIIFNPGVFDGTTEPEEAIYDRPTEKSTQRHRGSRHRERHERTTRTNERDSHATTRSRSSRSRENSRTRDSVPDEPYSHHRRKHSHSRSRHHDDTNTTTSPTMSGRRSSHSLWPSFSGSERRSLSDIFDTASTRPRSSRSRTRSNVPEATSETELSPRKLEFAEYIAGKRIDHVSGTPLRPPSRPMGFVRSRSSTGERSEFFTRDKRLLRAPSEEGLVVHLDYDQLNHERRRSWHDGTEKSEIDPWQVKILRGIVKM